MLRGLLLLLLANAGPIPAWCQAHWLDKFMGVQACRMVDVAVDDAGNTYVIGHFSSTTTASSAGVELAGFPTAGGPDVLVAKLDPDGALLWSQHAGGSQVDLGLKLAIGPGGVAVTGMFTGTADLFGTSATAQGGSTDLFVALLDPANGQAQWVRTAGSPGYTDTPGGITMDSSGDVVVAGRFKGDAVFGTDTLHSTLDYTTGLPSFDVFIAAWSAAGQLLWTRQGSGSKDCYATDLVCDASDQLYITGQFSDSLTFAVLHPGNVQNGIFLLKTDPLGNELWFRTASGAGLNQASDLCWSTEHGLYMTGDVEGTMAWSDGITSVPVPNGYAHSYFILHPGPNGDLLGQTTIGSTSGVQAASLAVQADSLAVFGTFQCSFTGLQAAYGADGLFMATGSPDLFIAKHAAADLAFLNAQQFSGKGAKQASGIANAPDGLVFCGSFNQLLFMPRGDAVWGDPVLACSFLPSNSVLTYCNDPHYGDFAWANGSGEATGFVAKGLVEGRSPYDFWDREGTAPCERQRRDDAVQILLHGAVASDTVMICSGEALESEVPFPRGAGLCPPSTPTTGPFDHQHWSTGSVDDTTHVASTGWVSYSVFSTNGCTAWTDSVYVIVLPAPELTVSDSSGLVQNTTLATSINSACSPLTVWLDWAPPGSEVYWEVGGDTTFSDTVHIDSSGTYGIHVIDGSLCPAMGLLSVQLMEPLNVTGITSELVGPDTVQTCSSTCLVGGYTNTWYVDGLPFEMPTGYQVSYESTGGCNQVGITDAYQPIPWGLELNGSGWYTVHSEGTLLNASCGSAPIDFSFTDSVYVEVGTIPSAEFGNFTVQHCLNDTIAIPFSCMNCDSIGLVGPGVVGVSAGLDTLYVDENGLYGVVPISYSGSFPCSGNFTSITVESASPPQLFSSPPGGTVCPGDSVLLYTTAQGTDFSWTGPGTAFLPHADSIWADEPGDYFLTVLSYPGCSTSNGPVTVSFYGSPNITGPLGGILCMGDTAVLQVSASPDAVVQWQPPLQGNGLVQTVTAAGSYSCTVFSCGNIWNLSYELVASTVNAELDTDTFRLCQGEPVTISAPAGAFTYLWLPSGETSQDFMATQPGTFELQVTDAGGCMASSGPFVVLPNAITIPATATGDSICAGEVAQLSASGSGTLGWYATADSSQLLAQGTAWSYAPLATDTVYVIQVEHDCSGAPIPVIVNVQDPPAAPVIEGDTLVCLGDPVQLFASGDPDAVLVWTFPNGASGSNPVFLPQAEAGDAGTYACLATLDGCAGPPASWSIVVDSCLVPVSTGQLPNVFSPNGDGVNDVFPFVEPGSTMAELHVFNRWGQQVTLVLGRNAVWDGRSGTGLELPEGIYYYTVRGESRTAGTYRRSGYVQLLR